MCIGALLCTGHDGVKAVQEHKAESLATNTGTCSRASASSTQNANFKSLVRYDRRRRLYVCVTCDRRCARLEAMKCHVRCHTGERPYSCDVCQRTFTQRHHVRIHKRTHSGEKPYPCPTCNKAFADSSSLSRHIRVHSGERPFSCDVCARRFANSTSLTVHKHTHTKELPLPDCGTERCVDSDNSDASTETLSYPDGNSCAGNKTEHFTDSNSLDVLTNCCTEDLSFTSRENIGNPERSTNSSALDIHTNTLGQESSSTNADNISCSAGSSRFIEIVPHTRGTDGAGTTERGDGDWSAKVEQLEEEILQQIKQEPDNVCYVLQ